MSREETTILQRAGAYVMSHKKRLILISLFGFVIVVCGLSFLPKTAQLSYVGKTCVNQLTLFPGIQKLNNSADFALSYDNVNNVGAVAIAAGKTCFQPISEPADYEQKLAVSPWGITLLQRQIRILPGRAPVADVSGIPASIPASRPLKVTLSGKDTLYTYSIALNDKRADCSPQESLLSCDIASLGLKQGTKYDFILQKQFKQRPTVDIAHVSVATLKAVTIKKSTIKNKQTVYANPRNFQFATDKEVKTVSATLETLGEKPTSVPLRVSIDDSKFELAFGTQLKRETKYRLILKNVEGTDGSTLAEPKKIDFTMSGGPKVKSVSVGSNRVGQSATIYITFDQALGGDATKYVGLKGGSAIVTKSSDRTVAVQLRNLPRCTPFSLTVTKGIKSKYDIASTSGWSFASRTVCHTIRTVGYSVQGRPIQAYFFGNGTDTVLFIGNIHGNEKSANATMNGWIGILESRAPSIPKGRQIVVVPMANPDGYYVYGRKNARGVNLNRNFPTANWERDIKTSSSQNDKGGGGRSAGSEPETRTIMALTNQLSPRLTVTYHSLGSLVNSNTVSLAASQGYAYARQVGYSYVSDADTAETFGFTMTGTYEDWMAERGKACFLIELPSDYGDYSVSNETAMWSAATIR